MSKFEDLLKKGKDVISKADTSGIDFLAVQVTLEDLDGVFYVEVKDGKASLEPYEYNDRQCLVTISSENLEKLMDGKLDPVLGYTLKKLKVDGDVSKALEFSKLIKQK